MTLQTSLTFKYCALQPGECNVHVDATYEGGAAVGLTSRITVVTPYTLEWRLQGVKVH